MRYPPIRILVARFHESEPTQLVTDAPFNLDQNAPTLADALRQAAITAYDLCRSFDGAAPPDTHHDYLFPDYPWLAAGAAPDYIASQLEATQSALTA